MRGVTGWIRRRCCCYFAGCFDFASDAPTPRRVQPKTINATADQAGGAAAIHRGGKRHQELKIVGNFSSILF